MATYPTDVKIFIDEVDVTKWVFGSEFLTLTDLNNKWKNIDITSFLKGPGYHKITVTAGGGVGRVETRVEIK